MMGLSYTAIRVKDMKKSEAFYTKLMGMKVIGRRSHMPGELIVSLESKDTKQRLNMMFYAKNCRLYTTWKQDGVELDHLSFEVKDAKAMFKKLVASGAKVAMPLIERETPMGKFAMGFVKDPNGIWIGVRSGSIVMPKRK